MRKIAALLTTALFAGGLTTAALAEETHQHGAGGSTPTSAAGMAGKNFEGEHTMSGTISKIERDKGTLTLKAANNEELELHFPPTVLQNYKEGDQVTVHLGIAKAGAATGSTAGAATGSTAGAAAGEAKD